MGGCFTLAERMTGVTPSVVLVLIPAFLAAFAVSPAVRSRGLMNSSIPKLMRARPVPSAATHMPGGAHHHHQPPRTALLANPSRSISPQFQSPAGEPVGAPARPRNATATSPPMPLTLLNITNPPTI